ncbi:hypothetical protein CCP3SC1_640005 [Gammaproteobacteria bacterium]
MWQPDTNTPSAPLLKAERMYCGDTLPEHITVIGVALAGYWIRDTPAKSLPAEEHHLHKNATIFGSYWVCCCSGII